MATGVGDPASHNQCPRPCVTCTNRPCVAHRRKCRRKPWCRPGIGFCTVQPPRRSGRSRTPDPRRESSPAHSCGRPIRRRSTKLLPQRAPRRQQWRPTGRGPLRARLTWSWYPPAYETHPLCSVPAPTSGFDGRRYRAAFLNGIGHSEGGLSLFSGRLW